MSAEISSFSPELASGQDLLDYHELVLATGRVDRPDEQPPPYEATTGRLTTGWTGRGPEVFWAARRNGRLIGLAIVGFPEDENRGLAMTDIRVHPDVRRHGIGTALLRAALPTMRQRGRTVLASWGLTEGGAGPKWAEALGFRVVHHDVIQMLDIAATDPDLWQVDAPPGYRLARWVSTAPEELVESYAIARTAIHDAPAEDQTYQAPMWTPERVRAAEEDLRRREVEQRVTVAVHEATGTVAGLTEIEIHAIRKDFAYQSDTAVLAAHRGRGLGRFIKAGMVRWLRQQRPEITRLGTSTAADNVHMIRVNHQIGFTTLRSMVDVEAEVELLGRSSAPH
jgi:GNAT superfamily N-acetyltransferase